MADSDEQKTVSLEQVPAHEKTPDIPEENEETTEQADEQTGESAETNAGEPAQENGEQEVVAEGENAVDESQAEVTEEQTEESTKAQTEEQAEEQTEQAEVTEEQTEVTEEQTEVTEEQTEVTEEQTEVTEEQTEAEQTEEATEQIESVEEVEPEVAPEDEEKAAEEQPEVIVTNGDALPDDLDLTEEKVEKLREVFALYASDDSIDYKGFKKLVRCFGQNPVEDEAREWYSNADQNSDGKINFSEFCRLFLQHKEPEDVLKEEIRNCLHRLFPDSSDEIELKKVVRIMSQLQREASDLSQSDIQRFCEEMDINGNGKIDAAEFVSSLCGSGVNLD